MMRKIKTQKGLTVIEFTAVALSFFIVFFSFIELAIYLFAMQSLNNMSREAARLGAVCYPSADIASIVTDGASIDITNDNIKIEYLNASSGVEFLNPKANPTNDEISSIKYIRSKVVNYSFHLTGILKFLGLGNNGVLTMPSLETVLPAESLGLPHDYDPINPIVDTCQN